MLPGIHLTGENEQILESARAVTEKFESYHKGVSTNGAWYNIDHKVGAYACAAQTFIKTLTTQRDEEQIVGFKEIRWPTISNDTDDDWIAFMKRDFPCARYIITVRKDLEAQSKSGFYTWPRWHRKTGIKDSLAFVKSSTANVLSIAEKFGKQARVMVLEEWTSDEGKSLTDLVSWLGFEGCDFTKVDIPRANTDKRMKGGMDKGVERRFGSECHAPLN